MTSSFLFRIYDVDDSGSINITEMTSIISTMDELEGEENMQGKDSPAARYRGGGGRAAENCLQKLSSLLCHPGDTFSTYLELYMVTSWEGISSIYLPISIG